MFKDFGQHKVDPRDRAVRVFILVTSATVLALIVYVVLLMANIIPTDQSREYKRRLDRGQQILSHLDISITEAGFIKKPTSAGHDIYMPQLIVQIKNESQETFSQMSLECRFSRGRQAICGGRTFVNDFRPEESRGLRLRCAESMFTGAVIFGIGRDDAYQGLDYELTLITENIRVVVLRNRLAFKLL